MKRTETLLCLNFGSYKESIMLCVTNAPAGDSVKKLQNLLLKATPKESLNVMEDLIERYLSSMTGWLRCSTYDY